MFVKPISYYVNHNSKNSNRAIYSLGLLFEGIGIPIVPVVNESQADLVYTAERPENLRSHALWIKSCDNVDWDATMPPVFWIDGVPWIGSQTNNGEFSGDILYSTYCFVSGAFESVDSKDQWGVPIARGSYYDKSGLLHYPWVSKYCEILYKALCGIFRAELPRVPLWPSNKRYAIVLSHDVDAPLSYIDTDFRIKWLKKLKAESRYYEYFRGLFSFIGVSAKKISGHYPRSENDPNFCFESWMELQNKLNSKSTFYVATTTSADKYGDTRDVNYIFSRKDIVQSMIRLIDNGWAIGLHGSINSWRLEDRIFSEKESLQKVLGNYQIKGVRNHFWALDDIAPERTLAMQARAGFNYDSSLGLNDSPGYRRGIAWPFNPYDKSSHKVVQIIEIPPTIMDGGVFYRDVTPNEGKDEILDHIKRTFVSGGAVVINWHLEQLNPVRLRGAGPILADALLELVNDSEIYWASPDELYIWWKLRREKLGLQ